MANPRIFISYRRQGVDQQTANLLAEIMRNEFPDGHVFIDQSSIPPGADFPRLLTESMRDSNVLIAVIGPEWIGRINDLWDPEDFVFQELSAAVTQANMKIFPVLMGNTEMPDKAKIPPIIQRLTDTNAIEPRQQDLPLIARTVLVPQIRRDLGLRGPKTRLSRLARRWPDLLGVLSVAILTGASLFYADSPNMAWSAGVIVGLFALGILVALIGRFVRFLLARG